VRKLLTLEYELNAYKVKNSKMNVLLLTSKNIHLEDGKESMLEKKRFVDLY